MTPKAPPGLTPQAVWPPASPDDPWVAYLLDRPYRIASLAISVLWLPYCAVVLLAHQNPDLLLIGLVVALGGALIQFGGRTGYYVMAADGTIGERIGRLARPGLITGRKRIRVRVRA